MGSATLSLPGCSINCCKAKNLIGNPTWDFLLKQGGNKVLKSIYQPGNAFYISFLPLLQWTNPDKVLKADTAPRQRKGGTPNSEVLLVCLRESQRNRCFPEVRTTTD